jgi:hypothetical protein
MAIAAIAATPRPKNDCVLMPEATLAVACARPLLVVLFAPSVPAVPEPEPEPEPESDPAPLPADGEGGVLPVEPDPEAWPGLRFSVA